MTRDEVLKLALEVLEQLDGIDTETECVTIDVGDVITAIKEVLAQREQKPVANEWSVFNTGAEVASGLSLSDAWDYLTPERLERGWSAVCVLNKDNQPTSPPQRKPLTDEEMFAIAKHVGFDAELMKSNHDRGMPSLAEQFARAIEAALKEKNG